MKKVSFGFLVALCFITTLGKAQDSESKVSSVPNIFLNLDQTSVSSPLHFYSGSMAGVYTRAREERKLIFVDFYADWCAPCKIIEKETFTNTEFYNYVNKNYVSVKIHGDNFDSGEFDFADKHNVEEYPTLMVLNAKGEEIGRITGYKTPYIYLTELKRLERFAAYKR